MTDNSLLERVVHLEAEIKFYKRVIVFALAGLVGFSAYGYLQAIDVARETAIEALRSASSQEAILQLESAIALAERATELGDFVRYGEEFQIQATHSGNTPIPGAAVNHANGNLNTNRPNFATDTLFKLVRN